MNLLTNSILLIWKGSKINQLMKVACSKAYCNIRFLFSVVRTL